MALDEAFSHIDAEPTLLDHNALDAALERVRATPGIQKVFKLVSRYHR